MSCLVLSSVSVIVNYRAKLTRFSFVTCRADPIVLAVFGDGFPLFDNSHWLGNTFCATHVKLVQLWTNKDQTGFDHDNEKCCIIDKSSFFRNHSNSVHVLHSRLGQTPIFGDPVNSPVCRRSLWGGCPGRGEEGKTRRWCSKFPHTPWFNRVVILEQVRFESEMKSSWEFEPCKRQREQQGSLQWQGSLFGELDSAQSRLGTFSQLAIALCVTNVIGCPMAWFWKFRGWIYSWIPYEKKNTFHRWGIWCHMKHNKFITLCGQCTGKFLVGDEYEEADVAKERPQCWLLAAAAKSGVAQITLQPATPPSW